MDQAAIDARKKKELDEEVERVKKEYDERQRKKKEKDESDKSKDKKKEDEDKDKDQKNDSKKSSPSPDEQVRTHPKMLAYVRPISDTNNATPYRKKTIQNQRKSLASLSFTGNILAPSFTHKSATSLTCMRFHCRTFYQDRLARKRQAEADKRNRERFANPNLFPSVPKGQP